VLTQNIKKKILAINPHVKIAVIPNGVELLKLHAGKHAGKPKKKHILFLGRIEVNQKGLDLLLDAYAKNKRTIKYPLAIVGSGEKQEIAKLQKHIRLLHLTKHVKLYSRVEGARKEMFYAESICVVVPSRFETYSLVALEALARGIPLVTFDIPGLSWIPKGVAVKADPFNTEELSHAMVLIGRHPAFASAMRQKGKLYSRRLTWNSIAKKYELFIAKITNTYGK
jgi:glycosyltransferase involved in cell wall biosynthesis